MAITDKININFQLFSTGDPKLLVIIDTSIWSYIEEKPAIIEITVPGSEKVITYSFLKGRSNIFNTSNLYLSPIAVYNDLPDGLYKITVKGSPDSFCKHRDVLKTDKTKLELYNLYTSLGLDKDELDEETYKKIKEIKLLIEAAEALVSIGQTYKGLKLLKKAMEILKKYKECKDCE